MVAAETAGLREVWGSGAGLDRERGPLAYDCCESDTNWGGESAGLVIVKRSWRWR